MGYAVAAGMDENTQYDLQHARRFFDATVTADMAALQEAFLSRLPVGAHILDARCGSGRDAMAFGQRGCAVGAFDASAKLAEMASEHCGVEAAARTFADVVEVDTYDGIWCCASLLHVPAPEMGHAIGRLWLALRPGAAST